jgi:replicative DNA helicase
MNLEVTLASVPEAERIVIRACMDSRGTYQTFAGKLAKAHFTDSTCRSVWAFLAELDTEDSDWRAADVMRRMVVDVPDIVVWYTGLPTEYLSTVLDDLGTEVRRITEAEKIRRIQTTGVAMCASWPGNAGRSDAALAQGLEVLESIQDMCTAKGAERMADVALRMAKSAYNAEKGIPTGWPDFDKKTGGLFMTRLYVVGARPSCGKTACATTWGLSAARAGAEVLFISTETTRDVAASRALGNTSGEDAYAIRTATANPAMLITGLKAMPESLWVEDAAMNMSQIRTAITGMRRATAGPIVVIVDYLEMIRPDRQSPSREQEISNIVLALQSIAKSQRVAVVLMSQLNRKADEHPKGKQDYGPALSEFRGSGMIEQAADLALFLWRTTEDGKDPGDVLALKMRVAKNKISGHEFSGDLTLVKGTSMMAETAPSSVMKAWL